MSEDSMFARTIGIKKKRCRINSSSSETPKLRAIIYSTLFLPNKSMGLHHCLENSGCWTSTFAKVRLKSTALVQFLSQWSSNAPTLLERIEQLWAASYARVWAGVECPRETDETDRKSWEIPLRKSSYDDIQMIKCDICGKMMQLVGVSDFPTAGKSWFLTLLEVFPCPCLEWFEGGSLQKWSNNDIDIFTVYTPRKAETIQSFSLF